MNNSLPKQIKLIPISEAAKALGDSIDTVRRWDKSGVLHSERPDGKNRYFSQDELEKHKVGQPLPISEAAKVLGISATTLRRLDARNVIKPIRNSAGERVYTKDSLNEFLGGDYLQRQKRVKEDKSEPQPPKKLERPNLKPRMVMPTFLAITAVSFLLLVTTAVGNIKFYEAKSPKPSALGIKTVVSGTKSPKPSATPTTSISPVATLAPTPVVAGDEKKAKTILIVTIDEATSSASVNIREMPTTDSKKIGKAKNGDTLEFVSFDSGWYEVRLPEESTSIKSGSTGFISGIYIKKGETIK